MPSDVEIKHAIVRDGVIVIPKETTLPDGWSLS
jgi:hypothetical protein